jgi:hypothetical protein
MGKTESSIFNNTYKPKDNQELISIAFRHINEYKRARALADYERLQGNREKADKWELKRFRHIDGLELAMRAIQKGVREISEDTDEE